MSLTQNNTNNRSRRLVFVCQVFHPDTSSTSQLFLPLLESIADSGRPVLVLSGFPGRVDKARPVASRERLGKIEIVRSGLRIDYRRSWLFRALAYSAYLFHLGLRLLTLRSDDIVLGVSNPPFTAQLLWITSLARGWRYFYMLHDAFPEGLVALGKLREGALVSRIWYWLNGVAYRRARALVVLGRDMQESVAARYRIPETQLAYIPHWSPVEKEPIRFEDSKLARRLQLEGKFVAQYSGNMGLWNDMNSFVYAAQKLENHNVHFLFIGGGFRREEAQELSESLGLMNVTWMDFVPLEELNDSLAACHCALISQNQGLEGVAVPCKLYGILASARAVVALAPEKCEVALTIEDHCCGEVVNPGDVDELTERIKKLAASTELQQRYSENAYSAYQGHYQLQHAVEAFQKLFDR